MTDSAPGALQLHAVAQPRQRLVKYAGLLSSSLMVCTTSAGRSEDRTLHASQQESVA